MKIRFSYLPEEEKTVAAKVAAICAEHPKARVKHQEKEPPRKLIFITIPEPK